MEVVKKYFIEKFIDNYSRQEVYYEDRVKVKRLISKSNFQNNLKAEKIQLEDLIYIHESLSFGFDKSYNLFIFYQEGFFFKKHFIKKFDYNSEGFGLINKVNTDILKVFLKNFFDMEKKINKIKQYQDKLIRDCQDEILNIEISEHEICHFLYKKYSQIEDKNNGEYDNWFLLLEKNNLYFKYLKIKDNYNSKEVKKYIDFSGKFDLKSGYKFNAQEKISRYKLDEFQIVVFNNYDVTLFETDKHTIDYVTVLLKKEELEKIKLLDKNKNQVKPYIEKLIKSIDRNLDGKVDILESEIFLDFISKNQSIIQDINSDYIKNFVKVNNFLKSKSENIQLVFDHIKNCIDKDDFDINFGILNNQINVYNQIQFHSLSMVTSLLDKDMITFFEIYEIFDKIGIFNSNWENEVSNKLLNLNESITNLGERLSLEFSSLRDSIYEMENQIYNSISKLTYTNKNSIKQLTENMDNKLKSINSSIDTNNLLNLINTYQLYRINVQTKSLKK